LLLLLYLFNWEGGQPGIPGFIEPLNREEFPDSYLNQVFTQEFNKDGKLNYQLEADRIEHLPDSDITRLQRPRIIYHHTSPPWHVRAEKGIIQADGETIDLSENVVLQNDDRSTQLLTPYLTLMANAKIAKTEAPVILKSENGETRATGMRALLETEHFKLLSNVVGVYEQNPKQP
jgi:lipopolysaccharide export system protein LptC